MFRRMVATAVGAVLPKREVRVPCPFHGRHTLELSALDVPPVFYGDACPQDARPDLKWKD